VPLHFKARLDFSNTLLALADDGAEQTRGLIAVDRRGSAWL
jgi:hypothetical protein